MLDIRTKLDNLLNSTIDTHISEAFDITNKFQSKSELYKYIQEGAILGINESCAEILSVPSGNYVIFQKNKQNTTLVPINAVNESYNISNTDISLNWNKFSKPLNEDKQSDESAQGEAEQPNIKDSIDTDTVDRDNLLQAMSNRNFTVTSLADKVGVDPPAISRILREPQRGSGDPGGRNPSIGLAAKICSALRVDPIAAFPDIFGSQSRYQQRTPKGNRGSGMGGAAAGSTKKGAASKSWSQGNVGESIQALDNILVEANEAGLTIDDFYRLCFQQVLKETTARNVGEFLLEFDIGNWFGKRAVQPRGTPEAANTRFASKLADNRAAGNRPSNTPYHQKRQSQLEQQIAKANQEIVMPLRQQFANHLRSFVQDVESRNMANPTNYSAHQIELAKRLLGKLLPVANNILTPKWRQLAPGETPSYINDFKAKQAAQSQPQAQGTPSAVPT